MPNAPVISAYNIYIKPTYIVTMPEFSGGSGVRSRKQLLNEVNLKSNEHNGVLSKKAMCKLRNAVNWLVSSAAYKRVYSKADKKSFWFKVNFVTLTVPPQSNGIVSEKLFKKALHAWIVYARKYFYLKNYVWKIETHKDGRLHVHLSTDTFLHYKQLQQSWNRTLFNYGLLENHFKQFGNYEPNSTDVHSVRKVNDVAAYLCEYMAKKSALPEGYRGRIWSCNYELSHSNSCKMQVDPTEMNECMRTLAHKQIHYSAIESPPDIFGKKKKVGEIFFVNTDTWSRLIKGKIKDKYDEHRFYIRKGSQSPTLGYFEIDKFSEKTVGEYIAKNAIVKKELPCKIGKNIPKIGQTKLGLQF